MTRNNDNAIWILIAILFLIFLAAIASTPQPQIQEPEAITPQIPEVVAEPLPQNETITTPIINETVAEPNQTEIKEKSNMTIWAVSQYVPNAYPWNASYPHSTYLNDTVFQKMVDLGITHVQFWQWNYNDPTDRNYPSRRMTTNMWVNTVNRMKDYNLEPEFCLCYDTASAVELVTALGSDCMLYEVGKEPHVSGQGASATKEQYLTYWNSIVDAARLINPSAMYGGPAVGSYTTSPTNSPPYLEYWLTYAHSPDFISVHTFMGNPSSKASAITRATTFTASDVADLNTRLTNHGKAGLPILFTEAQYTSAAQGSAGETDPNISWSWDQSFCDSFTNAFFNACVSNNVYANFMWVFMGYDLNFDLVRPPSRQYALKPQYNTIQTYINGIPDVHSKSFSGSMTVGAHQLKSFSGNMKILAWQVKAFSGAMTIESSAAFCTWGTPTADQWNIFHAKGDVNRDGVIDDTDFALISAHWSESGAPGWIDEDINYDGMIDIFDYSLVGYNYGKNICDLNVQTVPFSGALTVAAHQEVSFSGGMEVAVHQEVAFSGNMEIAEVVEETYPQFATILGQLNQLPQPRKVTVREG